MDEQTTKKSFSDSERALFVTRKYKPVAQKIRPVITELPTKFRIERKIIGDPLATLPILNPIPPPFQPTGRYTAERRDMLDATHPPGFLLPAERDLMHHFMCLHNKGFAWTDSERGRFRTDFFPPIDIPVIPHKPWIQRNIPIPPGLYDEVCRIIRTKIDAGVYEPSNSSYRSRWFTVVKKDGKSLRIVHSLEPLNEVTIQHSGVTPLPEHLAEQFGGRVCGGILDLYVGYDERLIAESSRDLTTFQTPYGAKRLTTLPMGWTNSVPIFHDDVTFILQPEIPHVTVPFIDDVPMKGPKTRYLLTNGEPATIPKNPGIRLFIWEHFQNLNRVVQRMTYCGGTFSGVKNLLCVEEFMVLGNRCTPAGRLPDQNRVAVIVKWGPCKDLSEVRAFLGTIGVCRIFIRNFSHRANALVYLTRKDVKFEFAEAQISAQEDLKTALIDSPAIRAIDYLSTAPVILAVDTSWIAVGFYLCQCEVDNIKVRHYNRFSSITLNDRERRFSQPKLEIYGLYRALRSLRLYLIGVRNLVIEVDARYIKGMLRNPDIAPNASINRWIVAILTFHFHLVHVPGSMHGPDGLSRRPPQPEDEGEPEDDFEDWIDNLYSFIHIINPVVSYTTSNKTSSITYATLAVYTTTHFQSEEETISYDLIPRSDNSKAEDARIVLVAQFHQDLKRPLHLSDTEYDTFLRYSMHFFLDGDRLWRKDLQGAHKLVIYPERRLLILKSCHDQTGHKGFYPTRAHILERFWWPYMQSDINWYVRSCDICQKRQLRHVKIPPVVATPAPLFAKVYVDTMFLPPSKSFICLVQGRCSLIHYPEFRMLRREDATSLGDWMYEDIICRWGCLFEIVTDNGKPFLAAVAYLRKRYHLNHIRISGYNSRANGLVERPHYDVRQSLYKAADGDQSRWAFHAFSVFWAERVTARRRMGCSPYFAATGTHPLLPLDISEATYLQPPPDSILSTTDLLTRRAIALQKRPEDLAVLHSKVFQARLAAAVKFEKRFPRSIQDFNFKKGALVLIRNTQIEKSLNRKMRARYLGPLIVIARNRGGAYILCELDGTVLDRPIAAFRVVPYLARSSIPLPDNFIDIDTRRLRSMEESQGQGDDEERSERDTEDTD